jgi:hypothetical protein
MKDGSLPFTNTEEDLKEPQRIEVFFNFDLNPV